MGLYGRFKKKGFMFSSVLGLWSTIMLDFGACYSLFRGVTLEFGLGGAVTLPLVRIEGISRVEFSKFI